jgi:hypothetical protein
MFTLQYQKAIQKMPREEFLAIVSDFIEVKSLHFNIRKLLKKKAKGRIFRISKQLHRSKSLHFNIRKLFKKGQRKNF